MSLFRLEFRYKNSRKYVVVDAPTVDDSIQPAIEGLETMCENWGSYHLAMIERVAERTAKDLRRHGVVHS